MPDNAATRDDINLMDTLDRLRAERFPHIPRDLVREILRLHADTSATPADLVAKVNALVHQHAPGAK